MYRYVALGLITLLVGFTSGWKTQGWRLGKDIETAKAKIEKLAQDQEKQARQKETEWVEKLSEAERVKNAEISDINRKHDAVVASLRNRPERVRTVVSEVPSTTPACAGTTGAELARGDAEFLAGYAADAAKLEAALTQCETAYDNIRNSLQH